MSERASAQKLELASGRAWGPVLAVALALVLAPGSAQPSVLALASGSARGTGQARAHASVPHSARAMARGKVLLSAMATGASSKGTDSVQMLALCLAPSSMEMALVLPSEQVWVSATGAALASS